MMGGGPRRVGWVIGGSSEGGVGDRGVLTGRGG